MSDTQVLVAIAATESYARGLRDGLERAATTATEREVKCWNVGAAADAHIYSNLAAELRRQAEAVK